MPRWQRWSKQSPAIPEFDRRGYRMRAPISLAPIPPPKDHPQSRNRNEEAQAMRARLTEDFEVEEEVTSIAGKPPEMTKLTYPAGATLDGYLAARAIEQGKAQEIDDTAQREIVQ